MKGVQLLMNARAFVKTTLLTLCLLTAVVCLTAFADEAERIYTIQELYGFETVTETRYAEYSALHEGAGFTSETATISALSASRFEDCEASSVSGRDALIMGEESFATWPFSVGKDGLYRIEIDYYNVPGTGGAIERALYIDGTLPFQESYNLSMRRVFSDTGEITVGYNGDDMRPEQAEARDWRTYTVRDQFGYFGQSLYIYLSGGQHELTLLTLREPVAIGDIRLISNAVTTPSYSDYLSAHRAAGASEVKGALGGGLKKTQAEAMYQRSDPALYAVNDSTSPNTQPYDPKHRRLNAVGGARWGQSGQWISWEIDVPQDGLYRLGGRVKQSIYRDMASCRALYIDGELPFSEAENIEFTYSDDWRVLAFGDGSNEYLFYLTEGKHEIKLSVSLGGIRNELMRSEAILEELSGISLELIAVMGTMPDTDRDYQIAKYMPELPERMAVVNASLKEVRDGLLSKAGKSDENLAQIDQLIFILDEMVKKPDRIAEMFGRYRDLISGFGNWIMEAREQPLLIDYIFVSEKGASLPKAELSFFPGLWDGIRSFYLSFVLDYTNLSGIENAGDDADVLTVWIGNSLSGGRDQATALNKMIVEDFTAKTGIFVDLKLVPGGTILTATLAGNGPDVALQIDEGSVINFAMRNALMDISGFGGYDDVIARFPDASLTAYEYNGGAYALPETFGFQMMFYRTDILRDLGVDINDIRTWTDVIKLLPTLQNKNMSFGLGVDTGTFTTLLYQRGGSYYNAELSASALDSDISVETFKFWMEFFTNYGLNKEYNFVNRFRTGEMPIGIADYGTYNLLSISAPEIRGRWAMTLLPGTVRADGSYSNVASGGGAGAIIMKSAERPDLAWEFLKWWTSADVQYEYGMELEAVMGTGARYNTANVEAFSRLPWTSADRRSLLSQMSRTQGTPQVPGGYYTGRYLDFAKIAVYDQNKDPKETLLEYVEEINGEIKQKRNEFGLED